MERLAGSIILKARGNESWARKYFGIRKASHLYVRGCFIGFLGLLLASIYYFSQSDQDRNAITLLIASVALLGYGFNTFIQQRIRIGDTTENLLAILRGRWDEVRKDEVLLKAASSAHLKVSERRKLEYFLYTLFDVYEYAIHLIQNGYFDNDEGVATIYEEMIKKTLNRSGVREIWNRKDKDGAFAFRNEYSPQLQEVVQKLLAEIDGTGSEVVNELAMLKEQSPTLFMSDLKRLTIGASLIAVAACAPIALSGSGIGPSAVLLVAACTGLAVILTCLFAPQLLPKGQVAATSKWLVTSVVISVLSAASYSSIVYLDSLVLSIAHPLVTYGYSTVLSLPIVIPIAMIGSVLLRRWIGQRLV